ncbi:hypothetical protein [uncultured Tateyamaria sp.]|uniref:hypothetical protein n=1 Tax=uncultured Tateyamaria sp. TaxID=455651 RepID=UPI002601B05A|nr:hypothetical protein [uncultured Tateyamaria sp.]
MPRHCAVFMPRSAKLLVTFDHFGSIHSAPPRLPWGHALAAEMGWSHLGNMTKQNDWFRHKDMFALYRKLRDEAFFADFEEVVFYGASMGGYAACAFSVVRPGARVVAISPQTTLRKSIVPFETRFPEGRKLGQWSGPWVDAAETARSASSVKIIYDPWWGPDAAHAARFTGRRVDRYVAPFMGHRVPQHLKSMGLMSTVASRAIKGGLHPTKFRSLLRKRHRDAGYVTALLKRAQRAGHGGLVNRLLDGGALPLSDAQKNVLRQ